MAKVNKKQIKDNKIIINAGGAGIDLLKGLCMEKKMYRMREKRKIYIHI